MQPKANGADPSPSATGLRGRGWQGKIRAALASSWPLLCLEMFSKSATFQQTPSLKHPMYLSAQSFAQLQPLRLCFKAWNCVLYKSELILLKVWHEYKHRQCQTQRPPCFPACARAIISFLRLSQYSLFKLRLWFSTPAPARRGVCDLLLQAM